LTFSSWENLAEESGFELNEAVFDHLLARLGTALLNGHDCFMELGECHFTQFGVFYALKQHLNQLELFKLAGSLQLGWVKFAHHFDHQFSDLKNGVSCSNLDKIFDEWTAPFLGNVLDCVLAHLEATGLALH